ncbi:MAG: enoyl-CoA hydratase/isomerase family protein [Acidimicrobiales bacterium]|nr:enoyl-CoA hydratase/isomerase family protein [Acidimicrobiales bacterium]
MNEAEFETISATVDGMIGRLTLNRPKKLNPLSTQTLLELAAAARWFDDRRAVKVVIVSGAGTTFSAGADVSAFGDDAGNFGLSAREAADTGREMADAIERMRAVTIAAIGGHCIGGGLVLAAACDLRIAADDTYFSIPEIDLGIPLAWGGIPRLVREIGPAMTRELVLTCRPFTAEEAKGLGFLNRIVAADEVTAEAEKLAHELATKSTLTLQVTKRHVNAVVESMSNAGRNLADADSLVAALHDPESRQRGEEYLARVRRS